MRRIYYALLCVALITATGINAQVSNYSFSQSAGTYTAIVGTSLTTTGFYDDNNFVPVPIPFTFTYHGSGFTTVGVSANGYIQLGATTATSYTPLSTQTNCIAAFGADLYGNNGVGASIQYTTLGSTPNRVFVIQWTNWGFYSSALNEATFQIRLSETSGQIDVVFGTCPGTTSHTLQLGLTGAAVSDFNDRTTTTNWAATTAGGANTATMQFSSAVKPTSGQTYTWMPSVNAPTVTSFSPTTVCPGSTFTITGTNFTGATAVTVNGSPVAGFVVNTATQITATLSPVNTTGIITVTAPTGSGSSGTSLTVSPGVGVAAVTSNPASICSGGSATLTASAFPVGLAYCTPPYTTGTTFGDYITNVTLGTINNTTGASTAPYNTYYSATNTFLTAGSSYTVTGILNNGGTEDVAVWIDYNQDGTFSAAEKLGEQQVLNFSIGFTVPMTAYNGVTRMRVRNVYFTTGLLPCTSYTYGENEDYNVTITGGTVNPTITNFNWSPATFLTSTTGNPVTANGVTATTTYTVVATSASGCTGSNSGSIVVGAPLSSTATISPASTVCAGTNITLNGNQTGGGTPYSYSWSGPNGFTSTLQNPVISNVQSADAGTYTLTVNCPCGGPAVSTVTLGVNPVPTLTVTPTSAILCPGAPGLSLSATGATTYLWSPATGLSSTTVSNPTATPSMTTTYTVTGTTAGCSSTGSVAITVPTNFSVTTSATPNPVCSGVNSQLTGTAALAGYNSSSVAYTTQPCQSNAGPTGDDVVMGNVPIGFSFSYFGVTYTQLGISTNGNLQMGDGSGATNNPAYNNSWTDVAIPNTGLPNNMIALCWDDWFINAGEVTYGTSGSAPNRKFIVCFNTTGRGSGSADTLNGQIVLEETTNNIYLTLTKKGIQPANTATQGVEDQTGSAASIGVAGRQSVAWSATNNTILFAPPTATFTYSWTPATFLSSTTISNPMANAPTTTTNYTLTVTDNNGCPKNSTLTLTVNPLPTVTASTTASSVCSGNSVTFTGGGATSYTWTGGVTNGVPFTPASTNSYTVTGTDGNGCSNTATTSVTVNPLPTVTASVTSNTICSGNSVTFTGGGATSYTWTGGVTNGVPFTPASTNTYTVTGTDGNGCTNTASTTVTVNPLPTVTANVTSNSICTGSSVTFTGGGATSYTWTGGVTNGVPFTPASTNTYTVTGTDANGCSNTANTTVTVNPLPTVTANVTSNSICAGSSVTFTGGGATSYTWTGGVTNGVPFTPASTNTYTVTGTNANGCTNTASTTVTVNSLPTVTANVTSNTVCAGNSVTFTGGGATSYTWTGGVTNGVPFTPASTNTYTVTGTGANGCTNTATTSVTVNPLPTVTANVTSNSVCLGGSVTFTGGGATTYSWTGGVTNGVPFAPSSTATYTVTGTNANGCTNTATTSVTVNPLPVVTANVTSNNICTGSSVTFTGGGATSYSWTGGVTNGVPFTPSSTNTYTVTGTDANGCSNTANTTVTLYTLPSVAANVTSNTVCTGNSVTFTGSGASTYTWTGGVSDGVPFTPSSTNSYTVTGTDANGCSNTASTTVTVNPLPTVTANVTANAVCPGNSVTFTGSGATTYSWTGGVSDGVPFTPTITDTYTVTGTDGNGCSNTATTSVTVNPLPTVTANVTSNTICSGNNVTFTGGGATSYAWTGGVMDGVPFTPSATDTYTVTGTDANGCSNTATTTVTVNALPNVTASASPTSVCTGGMTTLTGGGANTYSWTGGASDGVPFAPSATDTYTVTGTDGNGCSNTATVTVTVGSAPVVTANATSTSVCEGSSVTLTGGGATTYTWTGSVTDGVPFVPSVTDTYTVTGSNGPGCSATATITVTVNPLPNVTLALPADTACLSGGMVTLSGESPAGGTWSGTGVSGNQFDPTVPGVGTSNITYMYTDGNGCSSSATDSMIVDICNEINSIAGATINVYPNPASDHVTINLGETTGDVTIELFDANGKLVQSEMLSNVTAGTQHELNLKNYESGAYLLRVTGGGNVHSSVINVIR